MRSMPRPMGRYSEPAADTVSTQPGTGSRHDAPMIDGRKMTSGVSRLLRDGKRLRSSMSRHSVRYLTNVYVFG